MFKKVTVTQNQKKTLMSKLNQTSNWGQIQKKTYYHGQNDGPIDCDNTTDIHSTSMFLNKVEGL